MDLKRIEDIFSGRKADYMGKYREFAVILPLIRRSDGIFVLYEVRSDEIKRQPGEVCFPGGEVEAGESPREAAVREACEEIGLEPGDIRLIAELDKLHHARNYTLYPFLAEFDSAAVDRCIGEGRVSRAEVKDIFFLPLDYILNTEPEVYKVSYLEEIPKDFPYEKLGFPKGYEWRSGGTEIPVYPYEKYPLWGITARITKNFADIINAENRGERSTAADAP